MRGWLRKRPGSDASLVPVLLLVSIVALPTAVVLWLVSEATRNEHLAVRQRLADVYQEQLDVVRRRILADWQQGNLSRIDQVAASEPPAAAFADCVRQGLSDSVILVDAEGNAVYPALAPPRIEPLESNVQWLAAERLEFAVHDPAAAAAAYDHIASTAADDTLAARAIRSQIRSLQTAGRDTDAVELLQRQVHNPRLQAALAPDGRWVLVDLMLLLAEKTKGTDPRLATETADALSARLNDYTQPHLGAGCSSRFAMHRLMQWFPDRLAFPTLPAEDLAAEYLERAAPARQQTDGPAAVWKVSVPSGRAWALFRTSTIAARLQHQLDLQTTLAGVQLTARGPHDAGERPGEFLSVPVGRALPEWRVSLALAGDDPFAASTHDRSRFYFWTAMLTIVATSSLAVVIGAAVRRQFRLARLKNDLVATVSHELKTPLAGIRLLVDTLLARKDPDPRQTREYLRLVAHENARLSRLIENFLTFSRLERGKQHYTFAAVEPGEMLQRATEAMQERLTADDCQFDVRVEPGLPPVRADVDALVTVLLNLLDNACKYSGELKRIALRAFARRDQICLAVEDHGIGLSPRHRRRIFDQFYQVDRQLTRTGGGCGLGLSIVRRIVDAHCGTIEVDSELGHGSTFTVMLPAADRRS